jgi:hypothetical protein
MQDVEMRQEGASDRRVENDNLPAEQDSEDSGDAFPQPDGVGGHVPEANVAPNLTPSTHPPLHPPALIVDNSLTTALRSSMEPNAALPPIPLPAKKTTTAQEQTTRVDRLQEPKTVQTVHLGLTRYREGRDSLETYRESLMNSFPSDFEAGIQKFMEDLQHVPLEQLTQEVATSILDSFVRRIKAIEARKEASELQDALL